MIAEHKRQTKLTALGRPSRLTLGRYSGRPPCNSLKQEALEAIGKLPDDVDMDEIMYRLYVLDKVRKGREDVEAGRTIAHEDLLRELEQW